MVKCRKVAAAFRISMVMLSAGPATGCEVPLSSPDRFKCVTAQRCVAGELVDGFTSVSIGGDTTEPETGVSQTDVEPMDLATADSVSPVDAASPGSFIPSQCTVTVSDKLSATGPPQICPAKNARFYVTFPDGDSKLRVAVANLQACKTEGTASLVASSAGKMHFPSFGHTATSDAQGNLYTAFEAEANSGGGISLAWRIGKTSGAANAIKKGSHPYLELPSLAASGGNLFATWQAGKYPSFFFFGTSTTSKPSNWPKESRTIIASQSKGKSFNSTSIAVSKDGVIHVAVELLVGTFTRRSDDDGKTFSTLVQAASDDSQISSRSLAAAPDGSVHLVWTDWADYANLKKTAVYHSVSETGKTWGPGVRIHGKATGAHPAIAIGTSPPCENTAYAVWEAPGIGGGQAIFLARWLATSKKWSDAKQISPSGPHFTAVAPAIAVDANCAIGVAWNLVKKETVVQATVVTW